MCIHVYHNHSALPFAITSASNIIFLIAFLFVMQSIGFQSIPCSVTWDQKAKSLVKLLHLWRSGICMAMAPIYILIFMCSIKSLELCLHKKYFHSQDLLSEYLQVGQVGIFFSVNTFLSGYPSQKILWRWIETFFLNYLIWDKIAFPLIIYILTYHLYFLYIRNPYSRNFSSRDSFIRDYLFEITYSGSLY